MSTPFTLFTTPAQQGPKDFEDLGLSDELARFETAWSDNIAGWTAASIIGNPWSNLNDAPRLGYYNPLEIGFGSDGDVVISWTPFPQRLVAFFTSPQADQNPQLKAPLTTDQVMELADAGQITLGVTTLKLYDPDTTGGLLKIPGTRCPTIDWSTNYVDFSPSGPRGWLDEYLEWSITFNAAGKMTSVMFTCENPAYYLTMWQTDPKAVLGLYQKYIDPAVQMEDLYLRYPVDQPTGKKGQPVIDPTTGNPAYDPTNKWNRGTLRVPGQSGGALHLTSAPNTLSAEIYLAAAATIARPDNSSVNAQTLICCAKYGQNFRNSDPNIGLNANRAAANAMISLHDPVGLYIQQPQSFSTWRGPNGEAVSQYWQVNRGTAGTGPNSSDQILHAVFDVPDSAGFTVNDVTINGQPISHVGVIAEQMKIALSVTLMKPPRPQTEIPCVASRTNGLQPWPVQFVPDSLFYGLSASDLPGRLLPGTTNRFMLVVQGATSDTTTENARVEFSSAAVSASVVKFLPDAAAIPGQTDGGGTQGFVLDVTVAADATPGPVQVRVLNPSEGLAPTPDEHPWETGLMTIPN